MNPENLETQVLSFLQAIREAKQLSPEAPNYSTGKEIEALFTGGVDFLRTQFPNKAIQRLASILWDVVGEKIVPVAYGIPVETLSFLIVGTQASPQAMIITPPKWNEMVHKDPVTQVGALVFVGSQAVDYAHERHTIVPQNITPRACAYEVEYLNTVKNLVPSWEFNQYQQKVMAEFPEGLASPKAQKMLYGMKPLITA